MQVTVTVPETVVREASGSGGSLSDFVESLIDKGMRAANGRPDLERAMAQFQALRAAKEAARTRATRGRANA
jgi:hypothetical protein